MNKQFLNTRKIILASQSPRRQQLLSGLNVNFDIRIIKDIDESYPEDLPIEKIALYLSQKKSKAYEHLLQEEDSVIITADTIVILNDIVLGKPSDKASAREMLKLLSGNEHCVSTGVSIISRNFEDSFLEQTFVEFSHLTDDEIDYYIDRFQPFDKAGSYGVQEWIGYVGVKRIRGSFYNVMGLPVHHLYKKLLQYNVISI